jgi:hypothetical protein
MDQGNATTSNSLIQFQKKFSTEKACQKHLFRLRWPEGFRCPRCQHGEGYTSVPGIYTIVRPAVIKPP